VGAAGVIGSHVEEVGRKGGTVPIATGLVQSVRPRIADQIGEAMPGPLGQGDLQSVVVTDVLVGDIVDAGQIRELSEIGAVEVLASRAGGCGRANKGCWRVGSVAEWPGPPARTRSWRVNVIQSDESCAVGSNIGDLQREIV